MKKGTLVMVASSDDNENYNSFRNEVLYVTDVATSVEEHPGYDETMQGQALCDLRTLDGEVINCSLYEYELEEIAMPYSDDAVEAVRQNLGNDVDDPIDDHKIYKMSRHEVFRRVLAWNGLINYGETIRLWVEDIYQVELNGEDK